MITPWPSLRSQLGQQQPSLRPCYTAVLKYSSFCDFWDPTCPSFEPIKHPRASYTLPSNILVCPFRYHKKHWYLISKLLPVFRQFFFIQFISVFFHLLVWPSIISFVSFDLQLLFSFAPLHPFLYVADFKYVSSFFSLQLLFAIFDPWSQNQQMKP